MKTTSTETAYTKYLAAQAAVRDGESRILGKRAMTKRWTALFAAEAALKASGAWL